MGWGTRPIGLPAVSSLPTPGGNISGTLSGLLASRPKAAGNNWGLLYYATDTALLYQSWNGAWQAVTASGGGSPGSTYGTSVLPANYPISSPNGTFTASYLNVVLPSTGTYLLLANLRGYGNFSAGADGRITAKLYDGTADVPNSLTELCFSTVPGQDFAENTVPITVPYVCTAPSTTITVYVTSLDAAAWTKRGIASDTTAGLSRLAYVKIA